MRGWWAGQEVDGLVLDARPRQDPLEVWLGGRAHEGPGARRAAVRRLARRPDDARGGRRRQGRHRRGGRRGRPRDLARALRHQPRVRGGTCRRCASRSPAGSTPGSPSSSCARPSHRTTGSPSCVGSPTTCWTCRRDDRRRADALAAAARSGGSPELAWAVRARRAPRPPRRVARPTVFRIASMTKSFTAATVLALRDRGELRLDDEIEVLADQRSTADSPPVTIRHVLSMASGLPSDDPWADRHLDMDPAELDAPRAVGRRLRVPDGHRVRVLQPRLRAARRPLGPHDRAAARAARAAPHTTWTQPATTTGRAAAADPCSATAPSPGWAGCGRTSRTWRRG